LLCSKKAKLAAPAAAPASDWDAVEATPAVNRWDATPGQAPSETPGRIYAGAGDATPGASRWDAADGAADAQPKRNRWDATPTPGHGAAAGPAETPTAGGKRSRWDATPAMAALGATPAYGAGGLGATPAYGAGMATPAGGLGMETPTPGMLAAQQAAMGAVPMTPEMYQQARVEREMDERNRWA
jgi:splicing factor 3B subunit 1